MNVGQLRTILDFAPSDGTEVCALFMRPGTFFVECEILDGDFQRSSQSPFGQAPPIIGLRIGKALNTENLGGY